MTKYASLSMEWVDDEPDADGKFHFMLYVLADNYNDASVVLNSSYIPSAIFSHQVKELHLTKIHMIHQGSTGVRMKPIIATNPPWAASAAAYFGLLACGNRITVDADDWTLLKGDWRLDPGFGVTRTSAVQFMVITMAGYEGTDDLRLLLEGWLTI